tara:strand:+ start:7746 stop:8705 length:960 start_codon:yes stop_codon:yes gene_type:complete
MIKYLSTFIILTILGILYDKYKKNFTNDDELDKYDLIQKFLLNGSEDNNKPILWLHNSGEINARNWESFYSRSSSDTNQPYISLCLESIVKHCRKSFNICLIDDDSFIKLLPRWNIIINRLASPIKEHVRSLAMAQLLYKYGGMCLPITTIVLKDLHPLYANGIKNKGCFVGETINRNISSTYTATYANKDIMGCAPGAQAVKKYIQQLELLNSRDYTNEVEFCGDINMFLSNLSTKNEINILPGEMFGAKDENNNNVLIDDLLGDTFINFKTNITCIVLLNSDIQGRIKYGWFNRLSREQVLNARTMVSKQLLIALNN